jgi:hypothetical protein
VRPKLTVPQHRGEPRIRPVVTQRHDLAEQHRAPHVRIVDEPLTDIRLEPLEHIGLDPPAHARLAFAGQIATDRLAVMADVTGNRRDRPAPLPQR